MRPQDKARKLRPIIEKLSKELDDEEALEAVELFPVWKPNTHYEKTEANPVIRVRDPVDDLLYKLIPNSHDSQSDWPPRLVPAIWTRVDEPGEEWPEWRQPIGASDAYELGAKVSHNNFHWVSDYNNNVWEPGVFGWTMVS